MGLIQTRQRTLASNVKLGLITSNATILAATNPITSLANGQLGVFTYNSSNRRWETTTSALALTTEFFIAMGKYQPDGVTVTPVSTETMKGEDLVVNKMVYVAPVKQVRAIGYNGTTGSLNFTTVAEGDEYGIKIINTTEMSVPYQPMSFAYTAIYGDTAFSVMTNLVTRISADSSPEYRYNDATRLYRAELLCSTAGTVFTNTATSAVTYGSTAVTTSAAHGVTAGQYIKFAGDTYIASAVPSTTTITLNRAYTGATAAALSNANSVNIGTIPAVSTLGVRLTAENIYDTFQLAVYESLEGSTLSLLTDMKVGNGSAAEIIELEKSGNIVTGYTARNQSRADAYPQPTLIASTSGFYSTYHFRVNDKLQSRYNVSKLGFLIANAQTDASTPSAFNAAFDTIIGNIATS